MTSVPVSPGAVRDSAVRGNAVPGRSGRGARRFNRASRRAVLNLLGLLVALFALVSRAVDDLYGVQARRPRSTR